MIISKIGSAHIQKMYSNQDFYLVTDRLKLLTDGCSAGKDSDFGTRLFCKLFESLETKEDVSKFEQNVENVFNKIFKLFGIKTGNKMKKEDYEFIIKNISFTILACFETDDSFIVKFVGDGYIITENILEQISYIKINYGPCPPYFVYNYMSPDHKVTYKEVLEFKTYVFKKSMFKNVGLASDGVDPVAFNPKFKLSDKRKFDKFLLNRENLNPERNNNQVFNLIQRYSDYFFDDTTILF